MATGKKRSPTGTGKGRAGATLPMTRRESKPKPTGGVSSGGVSTKKTKALIKAQVKRAKEISQSEFENSRAEVHDLEMEMDRTQHDEQLRDLLEEYEDQLKVLNQSASERVGDISSAIESLLRTLTKETSSLNNGDDAELMDFAEGLEAKAKKLIK